MQQLFQQLGEIEYKIITFDFHLGWDKKEFTELVLEKEKIMNKIKLKELEKDVLDRK